MLRTPTFRPAVRMHVLPFLFTLLLPCFAKADLTISPVVTQDGDDVYVDFVVNNFTGIVSMQFTVNWDPTILEYVTIDNFGLPNMDANNFATPVWVGPGTLTHSWFSPSIVGLFLPECSTIFRLHLNSINGQVSPITFGEYPTPFEIITDVNGIIEVIGLEQGLGCNGQSRVSGLIYNDTNQNCQMDGDEFGMPDCQIKVEHNSQTQYVTANAKGEYYFIGPAGDYTLSAILPENLLLLPCEPTVNLSVGANEVMELLFGANTTGGVSVSGDHGMAGPAPLLQASPNPLPIGDALNITVGESVNLQLFDGSGRLVRQWAQAAGTGKVDLGVQSGAYLLKATAVDGSSQVAKLVVF